jgi:predicted esterase
VALLKLAGAEVTLLFQEAGHELTREDVEQATAWLADIRR